MLSVWLVKCSVCDSKGTVMDTGMVEKICDKCKNRRNIANIYNIIKDWLLSNPIKSTSVGFSVGFFIFMIIVTCVYPHIASFGALVSSFGAIFIALKYKLDQTDYHKTLFEERYKIFIEIDTILWDCFHEESKDGQKTDWRYCVKRLDSIYRKSYFLFGKKTYQFIDEFRKAVVDLKMLEKNAYSNEEADQKVNKANDFLSKLLDGQKLSDNFPELKIDSY